MMMIIIQNLFKGGYNPLFGGYNPAFGPFLSNNAFSGRVFFSNDRFFWAKKCVFGRFFFLLIFWGSVCIPKPTLIMIH